MTNDQHPLASVGTKRANAPRSKGRNSLPTLGADDVHVWTVPVNEPSGADAIYFDMLSPIERARASQFKFEIDRIRFLRRRAALRSILAGYLGIKPGDVAYSVNAFGKPAIVNPQASEGLSFNASHSDAFALIAVARSGRLGVDIERVQPLAEAESIAARFFAVDEAAALARLDSRDRIEGFFRIWTRKEAVVKALGGGLSIALDSFGVSVKSGAAPAILRWDIADEIGQRWGIHHIEPAPGFIGALAVDRDVIVRKLRWRTYRR